MIADVYGCQVEVLLHVERNHHRGSFWFMVRNPDRNYEACRYGKTGSYDPDDEILLYSAGDEWISYQARSGEDVFWLQGEHVKIIHQTNKSALSMLKKRS